MIQHQSYLGIQNESANINHEQIKRNGFFVIKNLIDKKLIESLSAELDRVWENQVKKYSEANLKKINDWGQVRAPMNESDEFLKLITNKSILNYVDEFVGETAILHLQNGIILYPSLNHNQSKFHKDFPKNFISSEILSFNSFIALDDFTIENGGTFLVPGTHLKIEKPSNEFIESNKIQITCSSGSVIFFDSTLWHAGGHNKTESVRRAINMQWTKPFIKQQLDYPEILKDKVDTESLLAQKLGMWTIPPKSVDQYRVLDESQRTYRRGQG